ncbi:MAG: acyl-CoA desaturase [Saprospirales bacterium]|nr:acyl-CoA desaturase [Saprospirales bacterium]
MQQSFVKFPKHDPTQFYQTLRTRVNDYFQENHLSQNANFLMVLKTISMFAFYLVPYVGLLLGWLSGWSSLILWVLMGLGLSGIGLAVMHDANHGAYSKKKWVNNLLSHTMDLIGGNSFNWRIQHNVKHHTYTNIYELDEDIDDKPILRLSPHGKYLKIHRYQHWYALFLYTLATVGWVIDKDIIQLDKYNKAGLTEQNGGKPTAEWVKLIFWKVFFLGYLVAIPILVSPNPWWMILLGFLAMLMVSGFVITVIFQLAHVVEGPAHFKPNPTGTMENTWAIHQLATTADFAKKNPLITWYVGGLNFQVEHHLSPNVCHVHYPKISEIVKKTAQEFHLPYHEYPTMTKALASHLRVLKMFGSQQEPILS